MFWGNRTSRGVEGRDTLETDDAMVMFFSLNSIVQRAVEREPSSLPLNLFGKQKKPNSNPNNDNKNSDTSRVVLRVLTARSVQRVLAQVRKLEREKEREETEEKEPLLGLSLSLSLSLSFTLSLSHSLSLSFSLNLNLNLDLSTEIKNNSSSATPTSSCSSGSITTSLTAIRH